MRVKYVKDDVKYEAPVASKAPEWGFESKHVLFSVERAEYLLSLGQYHAEASMNTAHTCVNMYVRVDNEEEADTALQYFGEYKDTDLLKYDYPILVGSQNLRHVGLRTYTVHVVKESSLIISANARAEGCPIVDFEYFEEVILGVKPIASMDLIQMMNNS